MRVQVTGGLSIRASERFSWSRLPILAYLSRFISVQDLLLSAKHLFVVEAMVHFGGVGSSHSQMLALDDGALARLAIAASRVRRGQRRRWLAGIATKLDPPRTVIRSRERSRRARVRKKNGKAVLRVEVDHDPLVLALIESKRMSEAETADLRRVEAVVGKMLGEWAKHWQQAQR